MQWLMMQHHHAVQWLCFSDLTDHSPLLQSSIPMLKIGSLKHLNSIVCTAWPPYKSPLWSFLMDGCCRFSPQYTKFIGCHLCSWPHWYLILSIWRVFWGSVMHMWAHFYHFSRYSTLRMVLVQVFEIWVVDCTFYTLNICIYWSPSVLL